MCSVEGCDRRADIEWDHMRALVEGGATSLENIQPLCRYHHRCKTERDLARAGMRPP